MTYNVHHRRVRRFLGTAALVIALPLSLVACSSDDNADLSAAVSDAASDAGNAVESAAADVSAAADSAVDSLADNNADEGPAKDLALQVKAKLDSMESPGEPLITNINEATAGIVTAPNKVTGVDDGDNDGKDDDAKFTIESDGGDDKACVQSQDGVWEVTDDEC